MNALQQAIRAWEVYLNACFREREEAVRCILLGLLSGQNVFLFGKPGTAKSALVKRAGKMLGGANYFAIQFYAFSTPEDVFGPVSMTGLQQDQFKRVTKGYFPTAHVAFLDEIFRAGEGILSGLLWPLADRQFKNGEDVVDLPLEWCVTASNSIPEGETDLAALYDRLVIRVRTDYIEDPDERAAMLRGTKAQPNPPPPISLADLAEIHRQVAAMRVDKSTQETVDELSGLLNASGLQPSDRKLCQLVGEADIDGKPVRSVMKAESWLNGRPCVIKSDLSCLYHTLWRVPDEIDKVTRIVGEKVNPYDMAGQLLLNRVQEQYGLLAALTPQTQNRRKVLEEISDNLRPIEQDINKELSGKDPADVIYAKVVKAQRAAKRANDAIAAIWKRL